MEVVVLKIGKYDPTLNGSLSKYEGYVSSTKQIIDLPLEDEACRRISSNVEKYGSFSILGYSTLLRAIQTSECIAAEIKIPCSALNEVRFDLAQLVTEEEFISHGSALVRERFVESFVNDTLLETRRQLFERIRDVFSFLSAQRVEKVCLVSHSFMMKLLEATTLGIDFWEYPEKLSEFIRPERKTYEFGEGFRFNF
ncbi:hypothetical protein A3K34_04870 [candidate division WWE3 bacterium RIFOXYC1_FULL_40_10]|uniref:Phosphoglycerate mutase n=1 Tax=candidate division WWE3 bacterium RIFOXYA2_FULL_46_9 TaxID=1802636 RepID=A0A1F4W2A2_UNCKA|nr:MAG: hypothetical protein A3K58_04870 [candidate division WWE3 bacterium RIFOXYB1_FULL_40_22]OGC62170.1 MAG: hypothetical protein A3K37_04870 [candidate division WWE3 bacterium RIFOXYA1_FULL_40_11]OGC63183.1 MAG: hypothetical protein A2264_00625 [candidate division WWE3 bacterium RIFOXYA2_FULL_46_9]OGC65264.1 MAG: hypothetical protein A2326_04255 [candidate division WWE3 bacterium RIFOXYB2_FULL_41_6]OGC66553.1 MAG: hypothetical protein A3K34_04870 [candidate division WWE3 bacterium RIFOXYC1_